VIRYENYFNLEAAHIKPRSHGGLYIPSNGIALCRDIHWAFDKGFITLNDSLEVIVHEKVSSEWLRLYENKQIYVPKDPFFRPSPDNLRYHRDNVFGLFLTSGRL
jgi:predicted restriction endonuclease